MQTTENDLDEIVIGRPPTEHDTEESVDAKKGPRKKVIGGKEVTVNKDGSPRKGGSGRQNGSYSLAEVSLGAIIELFGGNVNAKVTVGRKWAEAVRLEVDKCTSAGKLADSIIGTTPDTKGKFTIEEL